MFFPIGDTPNPANYKPIVNWVLVATNILIYLLISLPLGAQPVNPDDPVLMEFIRSFGEKLSLLELRQLMAQLSAYDLFVFAHGYKPASPQWTDLFSSMFLHGGFLHLLGNMLFLWIFGDNVEHRLGHLRYLLVYLATGILATLIFSMFAWNSSIPLVGASGAISGVLGLYYLLFPRNKVKVFVWFFFFFDVILLPVRWVLGFYVLVDNLVPFLMAAESNIAYGAHLGGFFSGLGVAWWGEKIGWRWPWLPRRVGPDGAKNTSGNSNLTAIRKALLDSETSNAISLLPGLSKNDLASLTPEECAWLADALQRKGHFHAASLLLRTCLASHPGSGDLAKVYLALGLLRLEQGQPTAAYQHLLSVFDFDPDLKTAERARQELGRIPIFKGRH